MHEYLQPGISPEDVEIIRLNQNKPNPAFLEHGDYSPAPVVRTRLIDRVVEWVLDKLKVPPTDLHPDWK